MKGSPEKKYFEVDKEENGAGKLWLMEATVDEEFFKKMEQKLEEMKPSFKDFFLRVIAEKPDMIVILDKGARPYGTPFKKFLNDLHMEKTPDVIFWNDERYKEEIRNSTSSEKAQKLLKQDLVDSPLGKEISRKKIFFVDETYFSGEGATMLRDFFDANAIDGHHFSFSYAPNNVFKEDGKASFNLESELENDKRFTIYKNYAGYHVFPKIIADLYVADEAIALKGGIETARRFTTMEEAEMEPYKKQKA